MRNIWRLFKGDVKRMSKNVVTAIIVLGLVFMPSIFSWYNVLACWNVFDNTTNLKVAVVNTDEGYKSDLVPLKMNIGEEVTSALRENDQLDWVFTDEEDAIDGVQSGDYYAAVVISPSFSEDMMTFYTDDSTSATIYYYTNEKKSAIAPKITDQGADQVSYQVNEIFTETIAEAALNIASSLSTYVDDADSSGSLSNLAGHVNTMSAQMSQTATVISTYSSILGSAQNLVSGSASLITQAGQATSLVTSAAGEGQQAVSTISDAMEGSSQALSDALKASSQSYAGVSDALDQVASQTGQLSTDTADELNKQADAADAQVAAYEELVTQLQKIEASASEEYKPAFDAIIEGLNSSIDLQKQLAASMRKAATSITTGNASAQSDFDEAKRLAHEAQASVNDVSNSYETDVKPTMDELASSTGSLVDMLLGNAETLASASGDLAGTAGSVSDQLGAAKDKLDGAATQLSDSSKKLANLATAISEALASGDTQALKDLLASDTTVLATAIASPVQLERNAVFPAENFGSQMAPLYTTLALWIGALLLVVTIKVKVTDKTIEKLDNPKPRELFLGRFCIFALMSLLQSTCMAIGNMFFLGVQITHPMLYLVCFWVSGLVFTFMIYTLTVSFANLGKAIAVLLLIIQVTSAGGSFPLQMLPRFFQVLSPYLPATHTISAMRAAMMGVYQNDFWIQILELLAFVVPFAILGLALRKPLEKFLNWYVGKVEDSKLAA